jgi:hypothetical protein
MAPFPAPLRGNITTVDQLGAFVSEYWSTMVRKELRPKLIMKSAVRPLPVPKVGKAAHIPEIKNLGVFDFVSGQHVNAQYRSPTDYTAFCDRRKESSVALDDLAEFYDDKNVRAIYRDLQLYALQRDYDNAVLGMRAGIPQSQWIFSSSTGTAAGDPEPFDEASILAAREKLWRANVDSSDIRLYIGVVQHTDLLSNPRILNRDTYPSYVMASGEVGQIYGMRCIVSNNIVNNTLDGWVNDENSTPLPAPGVAGSPYLPSQGNVYPLPRGKTGDEVAKPFITALMCHKDWCFDTSPAGAASLKFTTSFENSLQSHLIVGMHHYGHKVWRSDHAVLIHSAGR